MANNLEKVIQIHGPGTVAYTDGSTKSAVYVKRPKIVAGLFGNLTYERDRGWKFDGTLKLGGLGSGYWEESWQGTSDGSLFTPPTYRVDGLGLYYTTLSNPTKFKTIHGVDDFGKHFSTSGSDGHWETKSKSCNFTDKAKDHAIKLYIGSRIHCSCGADSVTHNNGQLVYQEVTGGWYRIPGKSPDPTISVDPSEILYRNGTCQVTCSHYENNPQLFKYVNGSTSGSKISFSKTSKHSSGDNYKLQFGLSHRNLNYEERSRTVKTDKVSVKLNTPTVSFGSSYYSVGEAVSVNHNSSPTPSGTSYQKLYSSSQSSISVGNDNVITGISTGTSSPTIYVQARAQKSGYDDSDWSSKASATVFLRPRNMSSKGFSPTFKVKGPKSNNYENLTPIILPGSYLGFEAPAFSLHHHLGNFNYVKISAVDISNNSSLDLWSGPVVGATDVKNVEVSQLSPGSRYKLKFECHYSYNNSNSLANDVSSSTGSNVFYSREFVLGAPPETPELLYPFKDGISTYNQKPCIIFRCRNPKILKELSEISSVSVIIDIYNSSGDRVDQLTSGDVSISEIPKYNILSCKVSDGNGEECPWYNFTYRIVSSKFTNNCYVNITIQCKNDIGLDADAACVVKNFTYRQIEQRCRDNKITGLELSALGNFCLNTLRAYQKVTEELLVTEDIPKTVLFVLPNSLEYDGSSINLHLSEFSNKNQTFSFSRIKKSDGSYYPVTVDFNFEFDPNVNLSSEIGIEWTRNCVKTETRTVSPALLPSTVKTEYNDKLIRKEGVDDSGGIEGLYLSLSNQQKLLKISSLPFYYEDSSSKSPYFCKREFEVSEEEVKDNTGTVIKTLVSKSVGFIIPKGSWVSKIIFYNVSDEEVGHVVCDGKILTKKYDDGSGITRVANWYPDDCNVEELDDLKWTLATAPFGHTSSNNVKQAKRDVTTEGWPEIEGFSSTVAVSINGYTHKSYYDLDNDPLQSASEDVNVIFFIELEQPEGVANAGNQLILDKYGYVKLEFSQAPNNSRDESEKHPSIKERTVPAAGGFWTSSFVRGSYHYRDDKGDTYWLKLNESGEFVLPSDTEGEGGTKIVNSISQSFRSWESVTHYTSYDAGFYDENNVLIKSWDELIVDGDVTVTNGVLSTVEKITENEKLIIPNTITELSPSIFAGESSLVGVKIPDTVTSIPSSAFYRTSLTSITIPDSVTSIGDWAFCYCTSLTSVIIPDSVTSIGQYAFADCKSLINITIPNSVTSISNYAFRYCSALKSVIIPYSVTSIGDEAFGYCSSLTDVYYEGSEADFNQIAIGALNNNLKNATIHYETADPGQPTSSEVWYEVCEIGGDHFLSEVPSEFMEKDYSSESALLDKLNSFYGQSYTDSEGNTYPIEATFTLTQYPEGTADPETGGTGDVLVQAWVSEPVSPVSKETVLVDSEKESRKISSIAITGDGDVTSLEFYVNSTRCNSKENACEEYNNLLKTGDVVVLSVKNSSLDEVTLDIKFIDQESILVHQRLDIVPTPGSRSLSGNCVVSPGLIILLNQRVRSEPVTISLESGRPFDVRIISDNDESWEVTEEESLKYDSQDVIKGISFSQSFVLFTAKDKNNSPIDEGSTSSTFTDSDHDLIKFDTYDYTVLRSVGLKFNLTELQHKLDVDNRRDPYKVLSRGEGHYHENNKYDESDFIGKIIYSNKAIINTSAGPIDLPVLLEWLDWLIYSKGNVAGLYNIVVSYGDRGLSTDKDIVEDSNGIVVKGNIIENETGEIIYASDHDRENPNYYQGNIFNHIIDILKYML